MLALIGVLGIGLFIYLLAQGRHSMIVAFIVPILLIPIACGLYTGSFSLKDMSACITGGIQNTASLGIMAAFAVLYFTMMNDLGVFDVIVSFITRRIGNHIYPVLVATFFVSIASHLDGQAPSTILVTIPAMYPFFKKLKIRPQILAYILSLAVGIWNFLPWGAVNLTNSVVMGLDVLDIWDLLCPSMFIMSGCVLVSLFFTAKREEKRIAAGLNDSVEYKSMFGDEHAELSPEAKKLLPFNVLLTVVLIALLFFNVVNTVVVFMAGYTIAVMVNYRTQKAQMKHFGANASTALMICLAMILGGVFGNVLSSSGVLTAMIEAIVSVFPESWSPWLLPIFGVLSFPLGWLLALTAYHFGVVPVIHGVAANFGYTALQSVAALAPGYSMTYMACPMMPSTYLLLGVLNIDLKEHLRYALPRLFLFSLLFLAINIALGTVPIV